MVTSMKARAEQAQIARDYEENVRIIQAAVAPPAGVLDRIAALEARVTALEAQPAADEDGRPPRAGVWCKTKEAMRLTGYSRSGLRKLRQQNRIVFDFSGPHCLYDATSIVRKVPG
jgi:hypothetical protein